MSRLRNAYFGELLTALKRQRIMTVMREIGERHRQHQSSVGGETSKGECERHFNRRGAKGVSPAS
jgi:hypothetical protein